MKLNRPNICRKPLTGSFMKWVLLLLAEQHGPEDMWGLEAPGRIIHEVGTVRWAMIQKISAQ